METMTRRAFVGATGAFALAALAGCGGLPLGGGNGSDQKGADRLERDASEGRTADMAADGRAQKVLVAYFSCTGTTERMARLVASELDATEYRIEAQDPYGEADLAYYTDCRADREQADPSARPAIAGSLPDLGSFDALAIGYPIWHGQAPRIIGTFLEGCDLSGKVVLPFCTSHSSAMGSSAESLQRLCPDASWLPGRRFGAGASAEEVADWIAACSL